MDPALGGKLQKEALILKCGSRYSKQQSKKFGQMLERSKIKTFLIKIRMEAPLYRERETRNTSQN